MIIVDAVDKGKEPGEIFEIVIEEIPIEKADDFSVHQVPTLNMLKELRDLCNVNVIVLACQVESIPEEISPGLSDVMAKAVPEMCERIKDKLDGF
jgi:coenzyme F420 hydrogenase subunit delta